MGMWGEKERIYRWNAFKINYLGRGQLMHKRRLLTEGGSLGPLGVPEGARGPRATHGGRDGGAAGILKWSRGSLGLPEGPKVFLGDLGTPWGGQGKGVVDGGVEVWSWGRKQPHAQNLARQRSARAATAERQARHAAQKVAPLNKLLVFLHCLAFAPAVSGFVAWEVFRQRCQKLPRELQALEGSKVLAVLSLPGFFSPFPSALAALLEDLFDSAKLRKGRLQIQSVYALGLLFRVCLCLAGALLFCGLGRQASER